VTPIKIEELRLDPDNASASSTDPAPTHSDRVPASLHPRARAGPRAPRDEPSNASGGTARDPIAADGRRLRPQAPPEKSTGAPAPHLHPHALRRRLQARSEPK
jgi:hypothetical protein